MYNGNDLEEAGEFITKVMGMGVLGAVGITDKIDVTLIRASAVLGFCLKPSSLGSSHSGHFYVVFRAFRKIGTHGALSTHCRSRFHFF